MKQINIFSKLLFLLLLCVAGTTKAQTIHPYSFGIVGTNANTNWYIDYVDTRFEVTAPASISGDKRFTKADATTGGWSSINYGTLPLIDVPIVMGPAGDTQGCSNFAAGSMTGKIAFIWRGNCEFGAKALNAQNAGAVAVVICNNLPGSFPFQMGAGAVGASVTIPTFMISNADGLALSGAYGAGTGTVTMTITQWGQNLLNNLGFIPEGYSIGQNYATPANQLVSSGNPIAMQAMDGAFVANYGIRKATNVQLATNVTFTPTGGSPSTIHTASVVLTTPFDNTDPAADSIWAMFVPPYNLTGITGNGQITVKYTISSDTLDQFPAGDTTSATYYTTDSLYSKGRYDFTNNRPMANLYEAAGITAGDADYIWGNMYYVNKSGTAASSAQWTMSSNTDTNGLIQTLSSVSVYLFQWVDGSNGQPLDSFMEAGELNLVGLAVKNFATEVPGDTSGGYFSASFRDSAGNGGQPLLAASSWYYVAVELPGETSDVWFLGCDGNNNLYPRLYGRWENNYVEYGSPVWPTARYAGGNPMVANPGSALAPCPFGGNLFVDSVVFSQEKGLIPSVPLIVNNNPNAVPTVKPAFAKFDLYPNPATDVVNVSLNLDNQAKEITYTVVNSSARTVSKVTHNNIQNEIYSFSTSKLPSGNYFMIVTADGKGMFKKFTVLKP